LANANRRIASSAAFSALSQDQLNAMRQSNLGHRLLALSKDFEHRLLALYALSGYDDIRPLHGSVLRNLELEGTLVTVLAQRAGITHRAIAKIIQDLEQLGYVQRLADKVDRRATRIWFSEQGLRLLRDSSLLIAQVIGFYKARLGDEQVFGLEQALKRIIISLDINIAATGQQALVNQPPTSEKYLVSHNMGRYLAELADNYALRCLALMEVKNHFGIQIGHTAVLSHLGVEGMPQRQLAEAAGISQQAIGKQVRSLQELGYITVSSDTVDKRVRRVNFSHKGYAFIDDLAVCFEQIKLDYIKKIGVADFENLLTKLQLFINGLNLNVPATESH